MEGSPLGCGVGTVAAFVVGPGLEVGDVQAAIARRPRTAEASSREGADI